MNLGARLLLFQVIWSAGCLAWQPARANEACNKALDGASRAEKVLNEKVWSAETQEKLASVLIEILRNRQSQEPGAIDLAVRTLKEGKSLDALYYALELIKDHVSSSALTGKLTTQDLFLILERYAKLRDTDYAPMMPPGWRATFERISPTPKDYNHVMKVLETVSPVDATTRHVRNSIFSCLVGAPEPSPELRAYIRSHWNAPEMVRILETEEMTVDGANYYKKFDMPAPPQSHFYSK